MNGGRNISITKTNLKYYGEGSNDCEEMDTDCTDLGESQSNTFIEQSLDHLQTQQQLQRSVEASKQMLYCVFGNVISILEEYEQRELQELTTQYNIQRSEISIPDQEQKTNDDIKSIVQTQLTIFETHTKACPPEVLAELREELKIGTLGWIAVRAQIGIEQIQQTDLYCSQLYEILAKGGRCHQTINSDNVTEETMKEGYQAMLYGDHDRAQLDKEFKENPNKEATGPKTRRSEMIQEGADRISRACGDKTLDTILREDVLRYERDRPENLK